MLDRIYFLLILFAFTCINPVFSSGGQDLASEDPEAFITVIDSRGEKIVLPDYPETVVSLGPNITETIYALQKGDLLVGRSDYCDYPEQVLSIQTVGSLQEPNLEAIVDLNPDLVLASTHVSIDSLQALSGFGIPVAMLYGQEDFSGLYTVISGCGTLLGAEDEAEKLLTDIELRKNKILAALAERSGRPSVYYALGFGDSGDWTAGSGTFIDSMIGLAGGDNIVTQEGWSYSKEMLVEKDPQLIILGSGQRDAFLSLPLYKDLSASVGGKVYEIDENLLVRQGPRLIDGLETLFAIFEESFEGSLEQE
ncbi:MAG: hypothetical protein B6241_13695 [Spirochaetaceae bacterium 4572_59]|nr:MAG: hypothetical protein B6241_13695 [Spirochaetaceae bacterium 4572_59]